MPQEEIWVDLMSRELEAFKHAILVRNVLARALAAEDHESMEFNTPEALKKYLGEHPNADKSNHNVKDGPSNDNSKRDEDQPGYGDNPTQFADAKEHRQLVKNYNTIDKSHKAAGRLKAQYERLRSYRHNDPEKAAEVAAHLMGERANVIHHVGETIDQAAQLVHKAESAPMSPQEKHWVDFLGESLERTEKQLEALKDVTRGKGLRDILPSMVDTVMREMDEVVERAKHTTGILSHIVKP